MNSFSAWVSLLFLLFKFVLVSISSACSPTVVIFFCFLECDRDRLGACFGAVVDVSIIVVSIAVSVVDLVVGSVFAGVSGFYGFFFRITEVHPFSWLLWWSLGSEVMLMFGVVVVGGYLGRLLRVGFCKVTFTGPAKWPPALNDHYHLLVLISDCMWNGLEALPTQADVEDIILCAVPSANLTGITSSNALR